MSLREAHHSLRSNYAEGTGIARKLNAVSVFVGPDPHLDVLAETKTPADAGVTIHNIGKRQTALLILVVVAFRNPVARTCSVQLR